MVMDCIRLRRGIFLVILVAVAFSASVSAQVLERESERKSEALKRVAKNLGRRSKIELESLEHGKWGDKNDQKLVIRDAAGGEISASSGLGIFDAFFASLSMILVSEIGDETFIIAALMAMRHPKSLVLSGALAALIVMTAEQETDEVYAQITLTPEVDQIEPKSADPCLPEQPRPAVHSFCKILTASDTSTHGGFSVMRKHANECLPQLDMSQPTPIQELAAKDLHGFEWRFKYIFRGSLLAHFCFV